MMNAYDGTLLNKARISLANMFDYAVNDCMYKLEVFYTLFLSSVISKRFEHGDSKTIAGMSGIELAREIISTNEPGASFPEPSGRISRSPEYWLGWGLAYYQWEKNVSFKKITECIGIECILLMYRKFHELDISHFVIELDNMRLDEKNLSMLKRVRSYAGISQSELSSITGIPVRTIQQYEQKQKNINNAKVDYILRISRALHCEPEDILEQ